MSMLYLVYWFLLMSKCILTSFFKQIVYLISCCSSIFKVLELLLICIKVYLRIFLPDFKITSDRAGGSWDLGKYSWRKKTDTLWRELNQSPDFRLVNIPLVSFSRQDVSKEQVLFQKILSVVFDLTSPGVCQSLEHFRSLRSGEGVLDADRGHTCC